MKYSSQSIRNAFCGAIVVVLFAAVATGCGQKVKPIDLRDPVVPLESRKLIADMQDAVSIARLKRDAAKRNLAEVKEWREDMIEQREWPSDAQGALQQLTVLADARVGLAKTELNLAETEFDLADAKYILTTAQTAMRHDLAVYDLEPLRKDVERRRTQIKEISEKVVDLRDSTEKLTLEWWTSYSKFASAGGNTRTFFLSTAKPPEFVPPELPAEEEGGEAPATEAVPELPTKDKEGAGEDEEEAEVEEEEEEEEEDEPEEDI